MESQSKNTMVAIAAVVGIALGGLGGYYIADMNMDGNNSSMQSVSEDNPNSMTKAADLRVTLNQMMRQHIDLATVALVDAATDSPSSEASLAALDANSVELAGAVGSVYGDDAEESFLALWREHIGFFADYTTAKVGGDEAAMQEAKDNLEGYTDQAASFFADANPNIDKDGFQEGLNTHVTQVVGIVDAYAAGNYEQAFETQEEAYNHIGMAADNLADAIVKQYPDKF